MEQLATKVGSNFILLLQYLSETPAIEEKLRAKGRKSREQKDPEYEVDYTCIQELKRPLIFYGANVLFCFT